MLSRRTSAPLILISILIGAVSHVYSRAQSLAEYALRRGQRAETHSISEAGKITKVCTITNRSGDCDTFAL